jgi:hypothetical protein
MQQMESGVLILAAAANLHDSAQIHYAAGNLYFSNPKLNFFLNLCSNLVLVASDNDKAPDTFQMFCPFLKFNGFHHGEDSDCEDLNYRFVVFGHSALIYNKKVIIAVPGKNITSLCYC